MNAQVTATANVAQAIVGADFDISNFTTPRERVTFKVPVLFDDDGEPTHGLIIVGKNSDEYRNEWAAIRAEGQKRAAKRKTAIDAATDEGAAQLIGLIDSNQKRLAVAVTVGWYGFTSAGAPAQFSKELANAALTKYPTWQDLVSAAMDKDENFLKLSSSASSPTPNTSSNE